MKPFKTLGSVVLFSSSLILATSCSKSFDEQMAKGDNEVGKFSGGSCDPFLGIQTRQNSMGGTYAYLGNHKTPLETQAFYGSDFSANNLLSITSNVGSPYYDPQYIRIGVTDQWINNNEVLSLKIQNGKAAKKMQMQYKTMNAFGVAQFYLAGDSVGIAPIVGGSGISGYMEYEAIGDSKEFDEVRFRVFSGKLALTGFTPNVVTPGPSGFYLVDKAGDRVIMRLRSGNTTINAVQYPNQYINVTSNFLEGPAASRQNRNPLPSLTLGSGEFTNGGSPVIPGSKTFLNITGGAPTLVYRSAPNHRIGVGDQFINSGETITITPGADFPGTKFRMVEVREASLTGAKIMISAYNGGVWVASKVSTGVDGGFTLVTSNTEFDEVRITWVSGADASIGRPTPGPVGANILLYPSCP